MFYQLQISVYSLKSPDVIQPIASE